MPDVSECDEATFARFVASSGTATDWTMALAGADGVPASVELDEDGILYLCPGTWYAQLALTAYDVGVVGLGGSEDTVLDAGGAGPLLQLQTSWQEVHVEGVTLTNGTLGADEDAGGGPALETDDAWNTTLTLSDVVVHDNLGGIELSGDLFASDLTLHDNSHTFSGSSSRTFRGGALAVSGDVTLSDTLIADNQLSCSANNGTAYGCTTLGAGVYVDGDLYATDLEVRGNYVLNLSDDGVDPTAAGAGLYVTGDVELLDGRIEANELYSQAWCYDHNQCWTVTSTGAGLAGTGSWTLTDTTFVDQSLTTYVFGSPWGLVEGGLDAWWEPDDGDEVLTCSGCSWSDTGALEGTVDLPEDSTDFTCDATGDCEEG